MARDDTRWLFEVAETLAELGAKPTERTRRLLWDAAGARPDGPTVPAGRRARSAAAPLHAAWRGIHRTVNEDAGLADRPRWEAVEALLADASSTLRVSLGLPPW